MPFSNATVPNGLARNGYISNGPLSIPCVDGMRCDKQDLV